MPRYATLWWRFAPGHLSGQRFPRSPPTCGGDSARSTIYDAAVGSPYERGKNTQRPLFRPLAVAAAQRRLVDALVCLRDDRPVVLGTDVLARGAPQAPREPLVVEQPDHAGGELLLALGDQEVAARNRRDARQGHRRGDAGHPTGHRLEELVLDAGPGEHRTGVDAGPA